MTDSAAEDVRRLPLFRGISEDTFRAVMRASYDQSFPEQIRLIEEGDPAGFLHILVEGMVELYGSAGGRDATMAVVRPVSTFILAASIRDAPYLMSARTLTRSRVVLIPSEDVRAAVAHDSVFAMNAIQELAACYRGMVRHAKNLKLRNTRERLAAYFLRQSRLLGNVAGYVLPFEKRLLASYMGMTPENLSRAFKSLADEGCKIAGQRVIITDRGKLEHLAGLSLSLDGPDPDAAGAGVNLPPLDGSD